ncbi:MAG: hypothetical protein U0822_21225 [Anaerolineae bacterium]
MDIRLTPDIEEALAQEAQRRGTTVETLALDYLRERFVSSGPVEEAGDGETLADFLGDYVGSLASSEFVAGGAQMSVEPGRRFASGMVAKRQQSHL